MQEQLSQAEKQVHRFMDYILQVITTERLKKIQDLSEPDKIVFYLIYSTSTFESTANFDSLVKFIKINWTAEIDREVSTLIEYMLNHREQCSRYEEINLATLKVANNLLASLTKTHTQA